MGYDEDKISQLDIDNRSLFLLAKGILWELLGHFPNAHEDYEKALELNPNNLISLQYLAHLFSKKGEYPKSKKIFQDLFQKRSDGNNPFNITRGFLGFRYRLDDIELLENLKGLSNEEQEMKNLLLSIYYLSIYNLKIALKYFEMVKNPSMPLQILNIISHYLYFQDREILKQLFEMKLEGNNELFLEINEILRKLPHENYNTSLSPSSYKPRISNNLIDLTNDINGWLDHCEGNLLYQICKNLGKNTMNRNSITLVEIGAFLGRSTVFIGQGLKERGNGVLFSIDPHEGIPYYHPKPTIDGYMKNIKKADVESYIKTKKGTSEAYSTKINEEVSLVFIDGDHTYDIVKKDFYNWGKKVPNGGYIAFHDAVLDGPFKIILEAIESNQWEFLQMVGNLALIQKKMKGFDDKLELLTVLNVILLHVNRQFHLDFVKNDGKSMRKQLKELMLGLRE